MRHTASTQIKVPATPQELAPFIDHTLLKADASDAMVETLCREAQLHHFYAVCVNGAHVAKAREFLGANDDVKIAAVVGFPLGAMATRVKAFEAEQAVADGASEIDMVLRVDLAKTKSWAALRSDVAAVIEAVRDRALVKVILETGLLSLDEIAAAAKASDEAGAHFVKTCTGFSTSGLPAGAATVEHVALMRASVRAHVQIKASGGVRDFRTAQALIAAGASRLGTSSGVALVTDQQTSAQSY